MARHHSSQSWGNISDARAATPEWFSGELRRCCTASATMPAVGTTPVASGACSQLSSAAVRRSAAVVETAATAAAPASGNNADSPPTQLRSAPRRPRSRRNSETEPAHEWLGRATLDKSCSMQERGQVTARSMPAQHGLSAPQSVQGGVASLEHSVHLRRVDTADASAQTTPMAVPAVGSPGSPLPHVSLAEALAHLKTLIEGYPEHAGGPTAALDAYTGLLQQPASAAAATPRQPAAATPAQGPSSADAAPGAGAISDPRVQRQRGAAPPSPPLATTADPQAQSARMRTRLPVDDAQHSVRAWLQSVPDPPCRCHSAPGLEHRDSLRSLAPARLSLTGYAYATGSHQGGSHDQAAGSAAVTHPSPAGTRKPAQEARRATGSRAGCRHASEAAAQRGSAEAAPAVQRASARARMQTIPAGGTDDSPASSVCGGAASRGTRVRCRTPLSTLSAASSVPAPSGSVLPALVPMPALAPARVVPLSRRSALAASSPAASAGTGASSPPEVRVGPVSTDAPQWLQGRFNSSRALGPWPAGADTTGQARLNAAKRAPNLPMPGPGAALVLLMALHLLTSQHR